MQIKGFHKKVWMGVMAAAIMVSCTSCKKSSGKMDEKTAAALLEQLANQQVQEEVKAYAKEYEIIETKEDGTYVVKVESPDFQAVVMNIEENASDEALPAVMLTEAIKEQQDAMVTYELAVTATDEESIETAYLNKVADEIMIGALKQMEPIEGGEFEWIEESTE